MKLNFLYFKSLLIAGALTVICISQSSAQGSVWIDSGTGQWMATANGVNVYTGTRMFDAVSAACLNLGPGDQIDIWDSGNSGEAGQSTYAITPRSYQTLDFHGNTINCNSSTLWAVPIYADRKYGVVIKNLHVTGDPRYGMRFQGCHGVTLTNIEMDLTAGLGIRVDNETGPATDLVINGNIDIDGAGAHGIETLGVDGVDIGDVTVTNTGGCGVILNTSVNCTVGTIVGVNNDSDGGYATFRVANNNGSTHVDAIYSTNSGRGFFSVSGSSNCTVDYIEVSGANDLGVWIQNSTNTHVLNGYSWDNPWCWSISSGSGNSVNVNCFAPGGTYGQINNRNSVKCLRVENSSTSNGANIIQETCSGAAWSQQFEMENAGSGYYRMVNRNSGKCLRIENSSTSDGAYVIQETCSSVAWSQQFSMQDRGDGYALLINRNSGKCLRVENSSTSDGAYIIQETCNSNAWSQQFAFNTISGSRIAMESEVVEEIDGVESFNIYPNPTSDILNIEIPDEGLKGLIKIVDMSGKEQLQFKTSAQSITLDLGDLPVGVYSLQYLNEGRIQSKTFVKE